MYASYRASDRAMWCLYRYWAHNGGWLLQEPRGRMGSKEEKEKEEESRVVSVDTGHTMEDGF